MLLTRARFTGLTSEFQLVLTTCTDGPDFLIVPVGVTLAS
jgi:hypothetical protein